MSIKPLPRLAQAIRSAPVKINLKGLTAPDQRVVTALAARINVPGVTKLLSDLSGINEVTIGGKSYRIRTRNAMTTGYLMAVQYVQDFYTGLGLTCDRLSYPVNGTTRPQLSALFPASNPTKRTLFVTSHLDSTVGKPRQEEDVAPGCDDDLTGAVANMLIAATMVDLRAMGIEFNCNVRFLQFGSEEQQLLGSKHYAAQLAANETDLDVIGQLQLEMMGYDGDKSRRVDIHDDEDCNGSHALAESMIRSAVRYGADLAIYDLHVFNPYRPSDHRPFLAKGYRALCISEDSSNEGVNPNMHSVHDTLDKLDLPYYVDVARFCGGGAIDLAIAG